MMGDAAAVVASSVGGDGSSKAQEVHTLTDGSVHTGPMPSGTHEMNDGNTMGGSGADESGGGQTMDGMGGSK